RRKIDIGENVAAVSNERRAAEIALDVFNSAAGFEQHRLVHEFDLLVAIRSDGGKFLREFVCVDDELANADVDQVIERESNEWFVKNRDKWLRQIFRERTKTRAESGAENKSLRDFLSQQSTERFRDFTRNDNRGYSVRE